MIDLIIVSLILIVVILLLIIAFLTFYIIYEHRKCTVNSWKQKNNNNNNEQRVVVPLLTLKTNDRSSGDHSNSASLISTPKRMTKRLRHRVKQRLNSFTHHFSSPSLEHSSFVHKILKVFFYQFNRLVLLRWIKRAFNSIIKTKHRSQTVCDCLIFILQREKKTREEEMKRNSAFL